MTTQDTTTPTTTEVRHAWDGVADGFDRYVTPHTLELGEHVVRSLDLRPGVRVLDVAAGSGALSIPAARTGATVVAVDISPSMVERLAARARAAGLPNLRATVDDGTALDLQDDEFDVTVSLNGVSVFPDLSAGLAEMVRVTRPGGEVLVATFGPLPEVEFVGFLLAALRAVAPDRLPDDGPLPPFRLAERATLERTLADVGLQGVSVEEVTWRTRFASVDDFLDTILPSNPIAGRLTGHLTDEQWDEVTRVLDGMLRERSGGRDGAELRSRVNVGRGTV